ncbi:aromatic-L-amino-acid decarboxylase-like [Mizuhopecten yessoensis]|uniref:Aromatic-L-amino-acid decarboxylase n=1 Tax=Mizuhopecten yessoensis TaxID=6573 RepID=A0A210R5E7_MIZYE|nr:aromatic-L-amino-acid decarboxylase-like [Mizuhopecten yessoensis]XP_021353133.1 aromatic-L-amino-acid decarboxylase-like [Mizuhopecten yessoensis]XP_021353144.1 aromatic-L-amino-acid decarboxylase-like [Mizuhopecten yessoensis]XP_021353154.1 aromatic-L-amino-acid decarboxylase-like [Mizuhopecten yessoensis]OWF56166.1 Aromatic-L-amino-acid decarboxylase [Mizuhopecten yessoensis]
MDSCEFRKKGKEMVDYIADYMENIHNRRVIPEVEPGYLKQLLPDTAPEMSEGFDEIMKDVERTIMPGITHWQHPHFHAYFPSGNSYPSILGDMLSDAIGCIGFSWASSPACTELEAITMDWLGKMMGLPKFFLHGSGKGGGVIQGSASECILVTLLAARHHALQERESMSPLFRNATNLPKLVAYCSKLSHSCVEKAGMLGFVHLRQLDVDDNLSLRGNVLEAAIQEDKKLGFIPFYVCATLGTTACCSFDNIAELGEVCVRENIWLHVDAAYAGNALICPEFQHLIKGAENLTSFSCNPNKWMLVNFDCSLLWVRDRLMLTSSMTVDPLYLQHKHEDQTIDLRHWGIPLSRRFRALKLWFVIRSYGVTGLQAYIRKHIKLAQLFETYVKNDARFEVSAPVNMGLVCFRLKGPNSLTKKLNRLINESGQLHMVPALINKNYVIRFALCAENANENDIEFAWKAISAIASTLLARPSVEKSVSEYRTSESDEEERSEETSEEDEEGDNAFMEFDNDIIFDESSTRMRSVMFRRSTFQRMISDPKCYDPKARGFSREGRRRYMSESCSKRNPLSFDEPIFNF